MQVITLVCVATVLEIIGSIVWGAYRYRLGNLPLFVPPGHGLVYLFGITAARLPVFQRFGRWCMTRCVDTLSIIRTGFPTGAIHETKQHETR